VLSGEPILLQPNLIQRPYRGGARLSAFRGGDGGDEGWLPEDWVGSVTTVFGQAERGLSRIGDGTLLRDAVVADPAGVLGAEHVAVFGTETGLLVKLIDAAQRLAIHLHPSRAFARQHLHTCYGKTEAWQILECRGPDAAVYLGFAGAIDRAELLEVVGAGQGATLLGRLNRLDVHPGDSVFVPSGVPHAIGAGVMLAEVQEPSDLLVRLEWVSAGPNAGPEAFLNDLGLGLPTALSQVECGGLDAERLRVLWRRGAVPDADAPVDLLPLGAEPFFRIERVAPLQRARLDSGFSILIVTGGEGELSWAAGSRRIERGMTLAVPYACGPTAVRGRIEVLRFRPPSPEAARASDPGLAECASHGRVSGTPA
jgi:mannose-6-phosphate isomerase